MLRRFFKENNKYFTLSTLIFILILAIGFYEPVKINELELNWRSFRILKSEEIARQSSEIIREKISDFLKDFNTLTATLKNDLSNTQNKIPEIENLSLPENCSVLIWRNSKLFYWKNEKSLKQNSIKCFQRGEVFFEKTNLTAELTVYDSLQINGEHYLVKFSRTAEKFYKFENEYFQPVSLTNSISNEIGIDVKIDFSPKAKISKDGRTFSAPIYNNFNNKIGMLYFPKPQVSFEKRKLVKNFSAVQNSLTLLIFLLFSVGLFNEIKEKRNSRTEVLTVIVLSVVLRYALHFLEIPKIFLTGKIIDPQYFSSSFGFGIVSSPLELTITLLFVLGLTFYSLVLLKKHFASAKNTSGRKVLLLFYLAGAIPPFIFRGFAASVKSFIFQSNLQYFESTSLFPPPINSLMLLNLLFLAVSFSNLFLLVFIYFYGSYRADKKKIIFLILIFLVEFSFFSFISHPLLSLPLKIISVLFLMYFAYVIFIAPSSRMWNYFFLVLFSSVFALIVLSNFNDEIRKESIKTAAREFSRPKENLYKFWLSQSLNSKGTIELLNKVSSGEESPYAAVFKLWSNLPFQKDDVPTSLEIIDSQGNLIGKFNYKFPEKLSSTFNFTIEDSVNVSVVKLPNGEKILRGVKRINENKFLVVDIPLDIGSRELLKTPAFVETKRFLNGIQIGSKNIFVLKVTPENIFYVYGRPNITSDQIEKIRTAKFSNRNEAWQDAEIEGADYQLYLLKGSKTFGGIRVIGLKKSSLAFTWFHFIKLFFYHSLLIFVVFIFAFVFQSLRKRKFKITFRLRLTLAFFVAAIIPLILLALYLRYTTKEKNAEAINVKLSKRAMQVERYLKERATNENLYDLMDSASEDLGVNFSAFFDSVVVYSSYDQYFEAGLLKPLSPFPVNVELLRKEKFKTLFNDKIENYRYHSVFYKTGIGNNLIIEVNDAFNTIRLPMSQTEFDIFLFGIYALAFIFALILSTFLANQISNPIHKLTRATASVGQGDLNVRIDDVYKGEVGELVKGFNYMVKELKRGQKELSKLEREIAWKEMARQVAHEIKNPLTPMKLSVQHLQAAYRDNSPKFKDILERVTSTLIEQIETLKNIASEFGNVAKMPHGELKKINITKVIRDAENLFKEENILIEVKSPEDNIPVMGDEDNLRRIFINLIRNSIQAGSKKISFEVEDAESSTIIRIKDDGHGIPQEYQEKIFEPNFTTKPEGMGLGLSIGKQFLESIGANITLEKSSAEGTTFLIVFPKRINK